MNNDKQIKLEKLINISEIINIKQIVFVFSLFIKTIEYHRYHKNKKTLQHKYNFFYVV